MRLRVSRPIRAKLARSKKPRIAQLLELDRHGLSMEGQPFPFWISEEVEIMHMDERLSIVRVGIITRKVQVTPPLPRNASVSMEWV